MQAGTVTRTDLACQNCFLMQSCNYLFFGASNICSIIYCLFSFIPFASFVTYEAPRAANDKSSWIEYKSISNQSFRLSTYIRSCHKMPSASQIISGIASLTA